MVLVEVEGCVCEKRVRVEMVLVLAGICKGQDSPRS